MNPLHLQYEVNAPTSITVYFDTVLHTRGHDDRIFLNEWDQCKNRQGGNPEDLFKEGDSELLKAIVRRLFLPESCVSGIPRLMNYSMLIHRSSAVSVEYIVEIVMNACREAGYEPTIGARGPSPKWVQDAARYGLKPESQGEKLSWWRQLLRGISRTGPAFR